MMSRFAGFAASMLLPALAFGQDPASPEARENGHPLEVVVEIPMGGQVKYENEPCTGRLIVDRFLSTAASYPANYGYLNGTRGEDGDALDALLLTRVPLVPGSVVRARAIGILWMTDGGEVDHKVIAVPADGVDPTYSAIGSTDDLSVAERARIENFFAIYKLLPPGGAAVETAGFGGVADAEREIDAARGRGSEASACRAPTAFDP